MKDLYIEAHEELIEEYMEAHPNVSWAEAYERCADGAYDRMRDTLLDAADMERKRRREEGE